MTPRDAYAALSDHGRRISALEGAATILSWDQETMMPPRGGAQRAESRGALAAVLQDLRTDPRIADWIAEAGRDDDWPADEASNGQPRERLTDAAFDQEGGARLAADDDFPAVELQPRQKQQVALDWASEREAAVVKSLAL